jgi:enamine deaminase RidA (YjgF/YER057c/UK114 family)
MNTPPIQRINPAAQWSDAVVYKGTAYFVEVPESGTDINSQSLAVFAQAERTLALAGTDKSRLLMATIYLGLQCGLANLAARGLRACAGLRVC